MEVSKPIFVVDLHPRDPQNLTILYKEGENLPVLQSGSTGAPCGSISFLSTEPDWSGLAAFTRPYGRLIRSKEWLLALRILVGGTASGCFIVSDDQHFVDAQAAFFSERAGLTDLQTNVGLRIRRLVTIKSAFGLSNTDLARICQISRTQLYRWLSTDETLQLEPANWQRLADLAQIAEEWNKLSSRPARDILNERVYGDATLLSLLTAPQLDRRAIHRATESLVKMMSSQPQRRDEKLRKAGIKSRPLVGQLAWDE